MLSPPCWSQHLPLKLTTMSLTIFLHLTLWTFRLVLNFEPGGLNCTRVHFSPPQLLLIFMKMVQFKEYCPYFQMFPLPPSALLLLRMSVFLQFWPQWYLASIPTTKVLNFEIPTLTISFLKYPIIPKYGQRSVRLP